MDVSNGGNGECGTPEKLLLTIQDAAELSGMSAGAIRKACANGELACIKIGKKKRLLNRDVFGDFLRGTTETAPDNTISGIRRVG